MEIRKIGIIGAGSLGLMYGSYIHKAYGRENFCFIVDKERKEKYENSEFTVNGEKIDFSFKAGDKDTEPLDLVIFLVKATGLDKAIETARPFVGENTTVISFMNGITSEEIIAKAYGKDHIIYAVVQGMDPIREGHSLNFRKSGFIAIGEKDRNVSQNLMDVLKVFDRSGLKWKVPEDIIKHSFSKLMLNCGVNQTLAVYNGTYDVIHKDRTARKMMRDTMEEVKKIANARDIDITEKDIDSWFSIIDSLDVNSMPSMVQDIRTKSPTEVDLFSGTIIDLGRKLGIQTPVSNFLYNRIRQIESSYM